MTEDVRDGILGVAAFSVIAALAFVMVVAAAVDGAWGVAFLVSWAGTAAVVLLARAASVMWGRIDEAEVPKAPGGAAEGAARAGGVDDAALDDMLVGMSLEVFGEVEDFDGREDVGFVLEAARLHGTAGVEELVVDRRGGRLPFTATSRHLAARRWLEALRRGEGWDGP